MTTGAIGHLCGRFALGVAAFLLSACSVVSPPGTQSSDGATANTPAPATRSTPAPKIALALGGGAARGFAHIGVIKVLEAHGLKPDIVVGTSAGSVVGALYASGLDGLSLQRVAMDLREERVVDWVLPDRGVLRGEALQRFINQQLRNQTMERLPRRFAAVATDLATGRRVVFSVGNAGQAVRASSAVPGVFQPVKIGAHEYVDGGLTEPVPVLAARELGADVVIAVDIGQKPHWGKVDGTLQVLLQTITIMGDALAQAQRAAADIVIRPHTAAVAPTDFSDRALAILEGEKAAIQAWPQIAALLRAKGL